MSKDTFEDIFDAFLKNARVHTKMLIKERRRLCFKMAEVHFGRKKNKCERSKHELQYIAKIN